MPKDVLPKGDETPKALPVLAHQVLRHASALTVKNFEVVLHRLCVASGFFSLSKIKQNFQSLTKKKKKI